MAREGVEVILGSTRDPRFGLFVCSDWEASCRSPQGRYVPARSYVGDQCRKDDHRHQGLQGPSSIRGRPPADIKAAKLCILRLSAMVANHLRLPSWTLIP